MLGLLTMFGLFSIVATTTALPWLVWGFVAAPKRARTVAGSLARLHWSRTEQILRYPAVMQLVFYPLMTAGLWVVGDAGHSGKATAWLIVSVLVIYPINARWSHKTYLQMKQLDDEDDFTWFKQMGRRLKRWLRTATRVHVARPVIAPR